MICKICKLLVYDWLIFCPLVKICQNHVLSKSFWSTLGPKMEVPCYIRPSLGTATRNRHFHPSSSPLGRSKFDPSSGNMVMENHPFGKHDFPHRNANFPGLYQDDTGGFPRLPPRSREAAVSQWKSGTANGAVGPRRADGAGGLKVGTSERAYRIAPGVS